MNLRHSRCLGTVFILFLLTAAGPLRADTREDEAGAKREIEKLCDHIVDSLRSGDHQAVADCFDIDRLWESVKAARVLPAVLVQQEEAIKTVLRMSLAKPDVFRASPDLTGELLRIDLREDGREAVAWLRLHSAGMDSQRTRLRLIRTEDGFKVYDTEDLDLGCPMSLLLSVAFAAAAETSEGDALGPIRTFGQALAALRRDEPEAASKALEGIGDGLLPPLLDAIRHLVIGLQRAEAGEGEAALEHAGKAGALNPDMPMLRFLGGCARNLTGDHEAALREFAAYRALLGEDADARHWEGSSLEALDRRVEAVASYRKGLDDRPDSPYLLAALGAALPEEDLPELAVRFRKLGAPKEWFATIVEDLLDRDARRAAAVLISAFRELAPESAVADTWEAYLMALEEKDEEAAKLYLRALSRTPPEDAERRRDAVLIYVEQMIFSGRPLQAYEALGRFGNPADSRAAFGELAFELDTMEEDAPKLLRLIGAHRALVPDDPWIRYYLGRAQELLDKRDQAEATYAEGMAETKDEEVLAFLRSARIGNRYELGEGLSAYRELGPAREAFRQLARFYSEDEDADGLLALILVHEEADPADRIATAVYRAEVLWIRGMYGPMVEILRAAATETEDGLLRHLAADRLVRGLLRIGKDEAAIAAAREWHERDGNPLILVLATAAAGDAEGTSAAIERVLDETGMTVFDLYEDPDLGAMLRGKGFQGVRERFPLPDSVRYPLGA